MHDLAPLTAMGGATPRSDTFGPLVISESPDWALASVSARLGQEEECAKELTRALGVTAPGVAKHAQGAELGAFWMGPHVWMLEAPHATHEDLAHRMKTTLGEAASVTEQTDAWVRFDMTGDGAEQVLERLCNLDMARMDPGSARRSVIEHLGCYVIRRAESVSLYGPRSSAQSLHHALVSAAKSVF